MQLKTFYWPSHFGIWANNYWYTIIYKISNSNWTEWSTIQGVIGRVILKSAEREARGRFEITSTITPWIVRHEVQLLINRNYNKIREEYDSGFNYLTGLYIQLLSYMPKKKPFKCN